MRFPAVLAATLMTAVIGLVSVPALAFSVAPVHLELKTVGREGRAAVTAVNHRGSRIGVDISIVEISMDDEGNVQELGDAEDEFLVFPPQTFIEPHGKQVFRLQWLGEPDIEASRTFIATVTEVPDAVPVAEGDSASVSVTLALAFAVVINVRPLEGKPQINVTDTELLNTGLATVSESSDDEQSSPALRVTFDNQSPVHGVLSRSRMRVELRDPTGRSLLKRRYSAQELNSLLGIGLLPPRQSRTLSIPLIGIDTGILKQSASATVVVLTDEN